jgi:16S rRNA G966 N2-methylase RsmD
MSYDKTSKKIFPPPLNEDYSKLKYDNEGLWSLTHPEDADLISENILKYVNKDATIIDTTSGCGGNLISFSKYFTNITGVEIDKNRYNILQNNLECYKNDNITFINDDCLNIINNNYDVYFFDPPWGGPKYKKKDNIELYLSDKPLYDIIKEIKNHKLIVIKIPYNYNLNKIVNNFNILEKIEKGNTIFLFFN